MKLLAQDKYYHVTGALLQESSIILPGSYGILINERYGMSQTGFGNPIVMLNEMELENYRLKNHKEKPSRFNCVFVCHSLPNLKDFIKFSKRDGQFGYMVEIVDNTTPYHVSDWKKFDTAWNQQETKDWRLKMKSSIKEYWDDHSDLINDPSSSVEILFESPLRVLKRVY